MSGVLVVDITKNNILATIDVTLYESLKDLYEALLALKKGSFADDERIRIVYNSVNQKKLIDELLLTIDIPDFFVIFELTNATTGIDFSFSDSFCIYPWINLRISTLGDISPCCKFDVSEFNENININNIKDIYLGKKMSELRQAFRNGIKPVKCLLEGRECWFRKYAPTCKI